MSDWRTFAACRKEDPNLFFPDGTTGPALLQIEEAKAVCRRCPVMDHCLQWALETGQDTGVWGGLSEDERRAKKRCGRPVRDLTADAMRPAPAARATDERTLQSLRDENTQLLDDGHVVWIGKRSYSLQRRSHTYRQICFAADRGRAPEGRVLTECDIDGCVHPQHISDEQERDERALARMEAADGECGSPAGARAHEAAGEELCTACLSTITTTVAQLAGAAS